MLKFNERNLQHHMVWACNKEMKMSVKRCIFLSKYSKTGKQASPNNQETKCECYSKDRTHVLKVWLNHWVVGSNQQQNHTCQSLPAKVAHNVNRTLILCHRAFTKLSRGVKIPELHQCLQQGSFPFQEKEDGQDSQVWILAHLQFVSQYHLSWEQEPDQIKDTPC